jgi:hypothetical protein
MLPFRRSGKTAVVDCISGRAQQLAGASLTSTEQQPQQERTSLSILPASAGGQPVTVCLWTLGGREEARELPPSFYSLASAFLVVYNPKQRHPAKSLDHWAAQCGDGQVAAMLSMVVVACLQGGGNEAAVAEGFGEGRAWCQRQGGVPHFAVVTGGKVGAGWTGFPAPARLC